MKEAGLSDPNGRFFRLSPDERNEAELRALYSSEKDIAIAFAKKLDEPLRRLVQAADDY